MWKSWLLVLLSGVVAQAADVCNTYKLAGSYAFQLSGMTTISGAPQPTVGLGRITFDGSGPFPGTGKVSAEPRPQPTAWTADGQPGDGELRSGD